MAAFPIQFSRKIDDRYGLKGTFLDADPTSRTQGFNDNRLHFSLFESYCFYSVPYFRTEPNARCSTIIGFASLSIENRQSSHCVPIQECVQNEKQDSLRCQKRNLSRATTLLPLLPLLHSTPHLRPSLLRLVPSFVLPTREILRSTWLCLRAG